MDPQSKLLMDEKYNLYGTTLFGGAYSAGTVFKVALDGTLTTLYSFTGGGDGAYPSSGVIADETGSLYGTTVNGGAHDQGAVYKLAPDGSETVLHSFYKNHNGGFPDSNLTMDRKGKLYGATQEGGANGHGTVFSLSSRNAATEDEK